MTKSACLILLLGASSLAGADLSGIWMGQVPTRNNDMLDVAFKFVQNGTKLEGKLYGDYTSSIIIEGKITGDEFTFVVVAQEQAGNQINETRSRYTGVFKDGAIELTREREGSKNAGNSGDVQVRAGTNNKQTFKLKRLI